MGEDLLFVLPIIKFILSFAYTQALVSVFSFLISASVSRVLRASFPLSFSALIKVIFILFVSLFG